MDIEYPSIVSEELLEKCRQINKKGFIKTMRVGDTGVGYTLETLLGIKANSNKSPDYKGIEIKTKDLSGITVGEDAFYECIELYMFYNFFLLHEYVFCVCPDRLFAQRWQNIFHT